MLTKAGDALEAAVQNWNNKRHWNFLRSTHSFVTTAPFDVTTCTTTSESTTVTAPSLTSVVVGDVVSGTGIRPGSYVVSVDTAPSPDTMELSQPASDAGTVTLTFQRRDYTAPTNFKYFYNMRDIAGNRVLKPASSRLYDEIRPNQTATGEPLFYDPHPLGADGKIRFLPTPGSRRVIEAKYHRRMTVPSVDGTALDIPIDLEWGLLAEAKSIFLSEKGGYTEVAAFWAAKAAEAFAAAVLADGKHPDEVHALLPSYTGSAGRIPQDTIADTADDGWGDDWGDTWGG